MTFLKRLFGPKKPGDAEYLSAMQEMADESERTHRGMIETFDRDASAGVLNEQSKFKEIAIPSGRGLYKARLFGSLFIVHAYTLSDHSNVQVHHMINVATGLALYPLIDSEHVSFNRDEAQKLNDPYLWPTLKAMPAAFRAGTLLPTTPYKREHLILANQLHDALSESIGVERYTDQVKDRFQLMIIGNVAKAMRHATNWIFR